MEQTVSNNLLQYEDPVVLPHEEAIKKKHSLTKVGIPNVRMKPTITPTKDEIGEVLNWMFPPEEFDDYEGNSYVQKVSNMPATLDEVKHLEEELEKRLKARHARDEGVCNIRREIFIQLFSELIRQETIECPERGLLFRRIRDEIRMSYSVYKSLYDSTMAYTSRKSVILEAVKVELERVIKESEPGLVQLRKHFGIMRDKVNQAESGIVERAEANVKRRQEEIDFHKTIGLHMKMQLEKILGPKKNL